MDVLDPIDALHEDRRRVILSVVVPAYNEQDVIPEFHRRLTAVIDVLALPAEIIYVDDGSVDATPQRLATLNSGDARVIVLSLSRNFGKEAAMTAGLDVARGDAVVVIDVDLQDPPELLPELLAGWRAGFDVVYAQRLSRSGESWFKRAMAKCFYRLIDRSTEVSIPSDTGDYRLLSRRAVESLRTLRERHRFMKGLFAWIGYRQLAVPYHRDPRFAGRTSWTFWNLWNFAIEGFTSFTIAPLKFASYLGAGVALVAFVYAAIIVYKTIRFGNDVAGYPSLIVVILFLGGVQLLSLGVIGEYLGRMFNESKQRPIYVVASVSSSSRNEEPVRSAQPGETHVQYAEKAVPSGSNHV